MAGPQFDPVARVLDTYTTPSAPTLGGPTIGAGSQWRSLVQGLATLNPALDRLGRQLYQDSIDKEMAEGARLQAEHQVDFKEAVKAGHIPEGSNPFLKIGYLRGELRLKGQSYHAYLLEEWGKDGSIQEAEAQAIPAWTQARTAAWRQANLQGYNDQLVAETFDPAQASAQNQLIQHHISSSFARTSERARSTLEQEIAQAAEQRNQFDPVSLAEAVVAHGGSLDGVETEEQLRTKFLSTHVQALLDDAVANGMSGSDANQLAIRQLGAVAELTGDRNILEAFSQIETGSGTLGQTTAGKQMIARVNDMISANQIRDNNLFWQLQERQRTENRRAQLSAFNSLALETLQAGGVPSVDPIAFIQANGITDPETQADIFQATNAMIHAFDRDIPDNDQFIGQLVYDMYNDPTFDERKILGGLQSGYYDTPRYLSLMDDFRRHSEHKGDPRINNQMFRTLKDSLGQAAKSAVGGGFGPEALNAGNAEIDLTLFAEDFIRQNPNATQSEFMTAMRTEAKALLTHYNALAVELSPPIAPPAQQPAPQAPAPSGAQPEPEPAPAQPAPAPAQAATVPPPGAIEFLRANSGDYNVLQQFDMKYGPGAAAGILLSPSEALVTSP